MPTSRPARTTGKCCRCRSTIRRTTLQAFVLPHSAFWAWAITLGEILVGLGLIFGVLTGIAAFFGGLMNVNYLMAGTVSTNPLLFVFATWLVLAWRIAGWYGFDRCLLPRMGTPWAPIELVKNKPRRAPVPVAGGED
jgi:thiosulfate dehydrogenase [quinone] large subunit